MSLVLASACALVAATAFGAAPAGQPHSLSWTEVVRLVDEHPRVREAAARTAAAEGAVAAAGAIPNPTLEVTLGRGVGYDGGAAFEHAYALSLPLDWLVVRGPRGEVARAGVEEAAAEARAVRREALSVLGALFWTAAFDQARVESLAALAVHAAEVAKLVRLRVEKGEARPIEVPRVETDLERVRGEVAAAELARATHRRQLEIWIRGLAGTDWSVAAGALVALPPVPDLEASLAALRAAHPSVEAGRARVRGLDAAAEVERRLRLPALALKAFVANERDSQSLGAGLEVTLPVWNWNSGRIGQAVAARDAEQHRQEAQARDLESAAAEVHGSCVQGVRAAERLHEQVLPRAERALGLLERSYQIGESGLLDVLDSRRVVAEARREYLAALLQAQLDCNRFQLLVGETR